MEVMIETWCGIDIHQKSIVWWILAGPLYSNKSKKIQKKFGTTTVALHNALDQMVQFLSFKKVSYNKAMAYNTDFKITSKWNIALSRQLKFLMLAAELSSRGKRKT